MGTPEYVSPEQATDAREADTRADIYSLGCTLYFLLTGRPPFQEDTVVKLVLAQIEKEPQPLHEVRPDVPPELSAVVAKMLAKDPAQRYQKPIEVAQALAPFIKPAGKPAAGGNASVPPVALASTGTRIGGDTSRAKEPGQGESKRPDKALAAGEKEGSPFSGLVNAPAAASTPKKAKNERKGAKPTPMARTKRPGGRKRWLLLAAASGALALLLAGIVIWIKWTDAKGNSTEVRVEISDTNKTASGTGSTPPTSKATGENSKPPPPTVDDIAAKVKKVSGIDLIPIPAGEFLMGSPESDKDAFDDEKPQHKVRISNAFYLGETKVTVGQFKRFVDATGYKTDAETAQPLPDKWTWRKPGFLDNSFVQEDDHPVVCVSWNDAKAYCEWLDGQLGGLGKVRLPYEAEWEYSCRAKTTAEPTTKYYFGDDAAKLGEYAWFDDNTKDRYSTRPVHRWKPNGFKLYDMHGLAWEWCWDGKREYPKPPSDTPVLDPKGPTSAGASRVHRGGSFFYGPRRCRAAGRDVFAPSTRRDSVGFRVLVEKSQPGSGDGFVPLFNGKDLTGWKTHPSQKGNWYVKNDGTLVGSRPPSHLFTERGDFENFHIKAKVRIDEGGNSGLFFRSEFGLLYNLVPPGYEVEIMGDMTGSLLEWQPNQSISHQLKLLKDPSDWFTLDVIADGDHVVILVNDQKAVDCRLPPGYRKRGHLALQQFSQARGWSSVISRSRNCRRLSLVQPPRRRIPSWSRLGQPEREGGLLGLFDSTRTGASQQEVPRELGS